MTALVKYEGPDITYVPSPQDDAIRRLGEWAQSADAAYSVATRLVESSFVPMQFRNKPVEATAAILAGIEVGLSPMSALRAFDVIQGQAAAKAITLRAIVQSHGHSIVLLESTSTRCRMKGRRRGENDWQTVQWTIDRAKELGLTGKDNWKKQPAAMLVARATSELARLVASDAILGIAYSAEEINDGGAYEQAVEEVTVAPVAATGTRRMSRRRAAVEVAPEPSTDDAEPASDAPGITDPQMKKMFALYHELGIEERDDRLADAISVIGRNIATSNELTKPEAIKLIDDLEQRVSGMTPDDAEQLFGGDA